MPARVECLDDEGERDVGDQTQPAKEKRKMPRG